MSKTQCINSSNTTSTVEPTYIKLINNKILDITNKLPVSCYICMPILPFKTMGNDRTFSPNVRHVFHEKQKSGNNCLS